jgi:hypothetical protein
MANVTALIRVGHRAIQDGTLASLTTCQILPTLPLFEYILPLFCNTFFFSFSFGDLGEIVCSVWDLRL